MAVQRSSCLSAFRMRFMASAQIETCSIGRSSYGHSPWRRPCRPTEREERVDDDCCERHDHVAGQHQRERTRTERSENDGHEDACAGDDQCNEPPAGLLSRTEQHDVCAERVRDIGTAPRNPGQRWTRTPSRDRIFPHMTEIFRATHDMLCTVALGPPPLNGPEADSHVRPTPAD